MTRVIKAHRCDYPMHGKADISLRHEVDRIVTGPQPQPAVMSITISQEGQNQGFYVLYAEQARELRSWLDSFLDPEPAPRAA